MFTKICDRGRERREKEGRGGGKKGRGDRAYVALRFKIFVV
jgi:hypothetical protein